MALAGLDVPFASGPVFRFEQHPGHAAKAALDLEGPGVPAFTANAHLVGIGGHASF